jgi:multiple sugar transport system substrate-binding protein
MTLHAGHRRYVLAAIAAVAAVASTCLAFVGQSGASQKSAAITIWVDAPRVAAVKAFEKAYPNIPVDINVNNDLPGSDDLEEKFALFNQAGSGWPDALFFPDNDDIAWASGSKINYTANLSHLVSQQWLSGYSKAAIAPCIVGGKLVCLRNDTAPVVFWYNATLFKQWGYTPPKTWPQYEALSLEIAKDHPGYYTGLAGDAYAPDRYLWSSGCPTNDVISSTTVRIDTSASDCTRARNMLSTLLAAKVVSPEGIFDSSAATTVGPKLVMTPGAVWYGIYLFQQTFKTPAGEMTATAPLKWPGDKTTYTGDEGGGFWGVSDHISGQALANTMTFMKFVVSADNPAWMAAGGRGFPAYGPLQGPWLAKVHKLNYFVDFPQLAKAFKKATTEVRPGHSWLLYDTGTIWGQVVTPAITAGQSLNSIWSAFSSQLVDTAKSVGYNVDTQ